MHIALPAPPPPTQHKDVARQSKVGERLASNRVHGIAGRINCTVIRFVRQDILKASRFNQIPNHRADRNFDHFVGRAPAMHLFPLAVLAVFCPDQRLVMQARKVVGMFVRLKNNISAFPPVPTVGSTAGDKFFPSKTDAPAPAIPRMRLNSNPIYEHNRTIPEFAIAPNQRSLSVAISRICPRTRGSEFAVFSINMGMP